MTNLINCLIASEIATNKHIKERLLKILIRNNDFVEDLEINVLSGREDFENDLDKQENVLFLIMKDDINLFRLLPQKYKTNGLCWRLFKYDSGFFKYLTDELKEKWITKYRSMQK
jgi:hypothetical protein